MYSFNNLYTLGDCYYPEDHCTFSDPFDQRDFTMKNKEINTDSTLTKILKNLINSSLK